MPYFESQGEVICNESGCQARSSTRTVTINVLRDRGWYIPWASEGEDAWCPAHADDHRGQPEPEPASLTDDDDGPEEENPNFPPGLVSPHGFGWQPGLDVQTAKPPPPSIPRLRVDTQGSPDPEIVRVRLFDTQTGTLTLFDLNLLRVPVTLKVTGLMLIHDEIGYLDRLIARFTASSRIVLVSRPVDEDATYFEFFHYGGGNEVELLVDLLRARYG